MQLKWPYISFKNHNIRIKKRGHNVTVLFSGRKVKDFFDLENLDHTLLKKASPLYSKMEN